MSETDKQVDIEQKAADPVNMSELHVDRWLARVKEAIMEALRPWMAYINDLAAALGLFDGDPYNIFEDAYREHAIRLNWKRPRGHKLSWRRLNREQRIEAIRRWRVHKR